MGLWMAKTNILAIPNTSLGLTEVNLQKLNWIALYYFTFKLYAVLSIYNTLAFLFPVNHFSVCSRSME